MGCRRRLLRGGAPCRLSAMAFAILPGLHLFTAMRRRKRSTARPSAWRGDVRTPFTVAVGVSAALCVGVLATDGLSPLHGILEVLSVLTAMLMVPLVMCSADSGTGTSGQSPVFARRAPTIFARRPTAARNAGGQQASKGAGESLIS